MMQKSRLGRGLDAIIPQRIPVSDGTRILKLDIEQIVPNPDQPRQQFDKTGLKDLVHSIKEHGLLQPIVVSKKGDKYEIIAGERRWQASKIGGLKKISAIVRKANEQKRLELALVENLQRESLNAIEEAIAYERLRSEFNLSLRQIGEQVGKQVATVSNKLRLLALPPSVQDGVKQAKISEGHARALLGLTNPKLIELAYGQILRDHLSVRQVEDLVKHKTVTSHSKKHSSKSTHLHKWQEAEDELQEKFGTRVSISERNGKGKIQIYFYSKEELKGLFDALER